MTHSQESNEQSQETWNDFYRIASSNTLPTTIIIGKVPADENDDLALTIADLVDMGEDVNGKWVDLRINENIVHNAAARRASITLSRELLGDNPEMPTRSDPDNAFFDAHLMNQDIQAITGDIKRSVADNSSLERYYIQTFGKIVVSSII